MRNKCARPLGGALMSKSISAQSVGANCNNKTKTAQVKVTVKSETAEAFKAACAVNGVSMASVLINFMRQPRLCGADVAQL